MTSGSALLLAALITTGFVFQEPTLLRRKLEPNTTDVYSIETKVKQVVTLPNGMGEQDLTISTKAKYTIKTLTGDADKIDIETTNKVESVELDGPMANSVPGLNANEPATTQKGKMDSRGRLTLEPAKTSAMAMAMGAASSASAGFFIELPEKAVKIGDAWDIIVPKSPMTGEEDQKLVAKLTGEKEFEGKQVWVVAVVGTIKSTLDTSKLPKEMKPENAGPMGDMKMIVKGSLEIAGEGLVDKTTGKTVLYTTNSKLKSAIELSDMGINIDSAGTVVTKVTLQK